MDSLAPYKSRLEKHLADRILSAAEHKDVPEFAGVLKAEANGLAAALREFDVVGYAQVNFDLEWAVAKAHEHASVALSHEV